MTNIREEYFVCEWEILKIDLRLVCVVDLSSVQSKYKQSISSYLHDRKRILDVAVFNQRIGNAIVGISKFEIFSTYIGNDPIFMLMHLKKSTTNRSQLGFFLLLWLSFCLFV